MKSTPISLGMREYHRQNLFSYWASDSFGGTELSGDFSKGDRNYLQKPEETLYPRLCMFALLLICQHIDFCNYLPVFYSLRSSPLTSCQGSTVIFSSSLAVSPPHLFCFPAPFCSPSMCCCNMNPNPDPVKHHMFLIILI